MYSVKRRRTTGVQVGCLSADRKEQGTQCREFEASYKRADKEGNFTNYDDLIKKIRLYYVMAKTGWITCR